jgi:NitT/TauT family transport system ATP-binding protein
MIFSRDQARLKPDRHGSDERMGGQIAMRALSKSFGAGPARLQAFGPADLDIEPGEFVSLLGPSGCGKSTLLLMMAGLIEPSEGRIVINGARVTGPRTDIGIMFQENTLVPWRTVRGNIDLQLELRNRNPRTYDQQIDDLIRVVHLEGFEDRPPYELSGGMQQRAAFCQALVHEPDTLLLDEPLGKLDAMTREAIRRDLQSLWMRSRPTVVLVTHSIDEAVQLSSRVCIITPRPGRIDKVIDIDLPRPRDLEVKKSAAFIEHVATIHDIFHGYGVL